MGDRELYERSSNVAVEGEGARRGGDDEVPSDCVDGYLVICRSLQATANCPCI